MLKPDYALELSGKGSKQANSVGQELKSILKKESIFFYISPFWRSRLTFERIVKPFMQEQIGFIEEPRLREQEWGHLRSKEETMKIENERDTYGPFYFRFPGGESCADVYDRVSDFFGTLHRDFGKENFPENAVIITHGMTIRLFLMRWFHWNVEKFESLANPQNCQLVIMEKDENGKFILKNELSTHMVKHKYQRPISY
jgi:broad specificity phosphatase PhoE